MGLWELLCPLSPGPTLVTSPILHPDGEWSPDCQHNIDVIPGVSVRWVPRVGLPPLLLVSNTSAFVRAICPILVEMLRAVVTGPVVRGLKQLHVIQSFSQPSPLGSSVLLPVSVCYFPFFPASSFAPALHFSCVSIATASLCIRL